jgi:hypothetical protein
MRTREAQLPRTLRRAAWQNGAAGLARGSTCDARLPCSPVPMPDRFRRDNPLERNGETSGGSARRGLLAGKFSGTVMGDGEIAGAHTDLSCLDSPIARGVLWEAQTEDQLLASSDSLRQEQENSSCQGRTNLSRRRRDG